MAAIVELEGKVLRVELSPAAERALARRVEPLYVEVQLVFGCMVAKRVRFHDDPAAAAVPVNGKLHVCFRPVRFQKLCSFDDSGNGAEAADFPLAGSRRRFVPDALFIDHRKGEFVGDFTYSMDLFRALNGTTG